MKNHIDPTSKVYFVEIDGQQFEVSLDSSTGEFKSVKNGKHSVNINLLKEIGANKFSVGNGKKLSKVSVERNGEEFLLNLGCRQAYAKVKTERDLIIENYRSSTQSEETLVDIKSPLPGLVTKVLVESGAELKKGQGVAIIEAMKMENEIASPRDARVLEVHIKEGDAIDKGHLIARLE